MKYICTLSLIAIAVTMPSFAAEPLYADKDAAEQGRRLAGQLMDQCATVLGANYLDTKCNYFAHDVSLKTQFQEHAIFCASQLVAIVGTPQKMVQDMDAAAKDVANQHECDPAAKSIVINGFNMSVRLSEALTKLQTMVPKGKTLIGN